VATEAAWLNGEKIKNHGKRKKLLTGIGLVMGLIVADVATGLSFRIAR
jgi:hypothetical protein